jgi:hypothetical protein
MPGPRPPYLNRVVTRLASTAALLRGSPRAIALTNSCAKHSSLGSASAGNELPNDARWRPGQNVVAAFKG